MLKKILVGGRNMLNFLMDPETTINGVRPGGWENPPIGGDLQRVIAPICKDWRKFEPRPITPIFHDLVLN